ncbi:hypothetical protein LCGC14_2377020 [marine sediment metagenome]|uniref:Uncharacterized protein n=1 Tax=marine sediment metagenome TaxID=412755 RepID=A0A0F9CPC8_9ZZZZ
MDKWEERLERIFLFFVVMLFAFAVPWLAFVMVISVLTVFGKGE